MMFDDKKQGGMTIQSNYDLACVEACKKVLESIKNNNAEMLAKAYEDLHVIIDAKLEQSEGSEEE